ncbi:MAG: GntR family transcriptional regulator [Lachnospiraceae bacterium]|nr:GntR family transcriptional regulator [Lachnospiraceae bacterium]
MKEETLYLKIYQNIIDKIRSHEYTENEPLPSERSLAEIYRVSRSTIRLALDKLSSDGYIYTIHGNGSFVKPQAFEQSLNQFYSFTDSLKASDTQIKNIVIDYELTTIDRRSAERFNCPARSVFHKLTRLRLEKDYPLMIEVTFLPQSRIHHLDLNYLKGNGSLYRYLADNYAFQTNQARETFRPILALPHERELLKISASIPCMLLERFSYEDNALIEYTKSVIRGDKYTFRVDLVPGSYKGKTDIYGHS